MASWPSIKMCEYVTHRAVMNEPGYPPVLISGSLAVREREDQEFLVPEAEGVEFPDFLDAADAV
jgi:hypothetical protein